MAKAKIPGPLERRHVVQRGLDPAHALRIAEVYLSQGRALEAIDFLRKADAADRLAELRREAVVAGDAFLLRAVATAIGATPARDEWRELAEAATAAGKDAYAAEARRQAERGGD